MYIILVALLVVVILWFVMKPDWAPKPPDTSQWTDKAGQMTKQATTKAGEVTKQATTKASEVTKQATAKAGDWSKQAVAKTGEVSKQATSQAGQMYQGLRGQFKLRADSGNLSKQFKQWVVDSGLSKRDELYATLPASADGFAIWLGETNDKELEHFTRQVAQFCASLNFDIAWLTDPEIGRDPTLKKAVEDAVLLYSLAAWRSSNVQQEVQNFLAYRAWLANPKRHKQYGQRLHQILIQEGLVVVVPDQYLASEQERFEQAVAAIRKVAEENPAAFAAALRCIEEPKSGETTAPAPTQEPAEPAAPASDAATQAAPA